MQYTFYENTSIPEVPCTMTCNVSGKTAESGTSDVQIRAVEVFVRAQGESTIMSARFTDGPHLLTVAELLSINDVALGDARSSNVKCTSLRIHTIIKDVLIAVLFDYESQKLPHNLHTQYLRELGEFSMIESVEHIYEVTEDTFARNLRRINVPYGIPLALRIEDLDEEESDDFETTCPPINSVINIIVPAMDRYGPDGSYVFTLLKPTTSISTAFDINAIALNLASHIANAHPELGLFPDWRHSAIDTLVSNGACDMCYVNDDAIYIVFGYDT
jgi:hypothetical protein